MSGYDPEYLIEPRRSPHVTAALLAALFSVGLHVGLIYWLVNQPFGWDASFLTRVVPRRVREMVLRNVTRPMPESRDAADSRDRAGAAAGAFGTPEELAAHAEELGLSPDKVAIEPSAVPADVMIGEDGTLVQPAAFPKGDSWRPQQEIVAIEDRIASDEVPRLERKVIPNITRVPNAPTPTELPRTDVSGAPEMAPPHLVDITTLVTAQGSVPGRLAEPTRPPKPSQPSTDPSMAVTEPRSETGGELFEETPEEVTDARPIEDLLQARATVFTSLFDRKYGYVRIEVNRASDDVLPPVPKDILLVQDSSNSMTEQRLYFCRKGLIRCLELIGPNDRFNVVSFQDRADFCFPTWQANTREARATAEAFAAGLRAGGNTDIMASLRPLMELDRTPGRPVIAVVVTDGRSTIGLTDSSAIIGRFTKANEGRMSVYTIGTVKSANAYLLDLLSYCNRGDTTIVSRGRWDIPNAMERVVAEASRPVLTDVRFRLANPDTFEVYPSLTSNLYLDRPLVLYGRFPRGQERLVFQAIGQAGDVKCDMIFDLSLEKGAKGDGDIRDRWAEQKIYSLMGEHARTPLTDTVNEIRRTARDYDVRIPYEASLGL